MLTQRPWTRSQSEEAPGSTAAQLFVLFLTYMNRRYQTSVDQTCSRIKRNGAGRNGFLYGASEWEDEQKRTKCKKLRERRGKGSLWKFTRLFHVDVV